MGFDATTARGDQPRPDDLWGSILAVAVRTPSPHNVQPWKVRLTGSHEAALFIDGSRTLPDEDPTGAFLLSAMGMFIESIDQVAAQYGLRLDVEDMEDPVELATIVSKPAQPKLIPFGRLRLSPAPGRLSHYADSLFMSRRTSRLTLRDTPVPASAIATLSTLAADCGHTYTHVSDRLTIEPMVAQNIEAVFDDLNLPSYHHEITGWFRYTQGQTERRNDGLDWRCMHLSKAEFWLSAKLPGLLRWAPARALFRRRYRRQLGHVPAIGILSGDFFNPRNAIPSGRFLLRFWMELARLDLYLHPYGNLVTNPLAAAWLTSHTGVAQAWLVFKLGYSDVPPLSRRLPIQEVLLADQGAVL